jgi:hypothetical protein
VGGGKLDQTDEHESHLPPTLNAADFTLTLAAATPAGGRYLPTPWEELIDEGI